MKAFTPDSSIASDVIPSPNYGERNNGRAPDIVILCRVFHAGGPTQGAILPDNGRRSGGGRIIRKIVVNRDFIS